MATHSSFLAWKISCTEEFGGLQSVRLQRVGNRILMTDFLGSGVVLNVLQTLTHLILTATL